MAGSTVSVLGSEAGELATPLLALVSCGLAGTDQAFHPSTLTYWRGRPARSAHPNRIFHAVTTMVAATGVLTGKPRRASDSTIFDDAVATQDTIIQLIAAIRRAPASPRRDRGNR